ncbi:ribosome biogenesis/translation initiation ATPase RLI [Candidatus Micrarchaeota archaeon]|nr:ribosome biogenesis/translation initiation ATPase RLI [Candidatus Micrarchaeota archaeon]
MVTRVAVIDRDVCIKEKCGYVCGKVCPPNRMGEECIVIEEDTHFPVISEPLCIGCGLCVKKCPVQCIAVINVAAELDQPIYQYGINTFRLYGLPLPTDGGAVSLVGKNGIGKSTAIKLLTRQIKPNFAELEKALTDDQILLRLPIDTRRYFAKSKKEQKDKSTSGEPTGEGSFKVSLKPQHIDRVRDVFDGTVFELLSTSSPNNEKLVQIAARFKLQNIIKRKISQLSGGELQKVAIAVACMKDADMYYFDEVTNYLDIEERLRVAVILKELAEQKSVMLAEHDLTVLDYVSTYVYLVYGQENTYGIVSQVKNVRVGINEYISGFLKEENVRFREHSITFSKHSEGTLKAAALFKYPEFKKRYSGFEFSATPGEIKKGEVLGLVGKNALGKSIFVKLLAGVEPPDSGDLDVGHLKLSYKPQYLTAEPIVVADLFARQSDLNRETLEECKRKLNVGILMEKKLTELSGGELQRVALTLAMSKEADIYLFDEPTAFLDIEQRFEFASLLRKIITDKEKSAFVVDHDIVFIDAIANRLIVFNGESSISGSASAPFDKRDGMNNFLKTAGITMRKDKDTSRPRINKPDSALDREQKSEGKYFYQD